MLKTDGYWLNDADQALGAAMNSGQENFTGRAIPLVALDWRYPLVRDDGNYRELVEPIVMAVVTPYGGNPKSIPNEDRSEEHTSEIQSIMRISYAVFVLKTKKQQ